jgi:hypothetical protein
MNPAETWPEPHASHHDIPQPETAAPVVALPATIAQKNPALAAFLALFPGLGNVYNGLYMRGITFFLVVVSLIAITSKGHPFFGPAIAFFWLFNVIDSYRQATLINYGYAQDLGLLDLPRHPRASQGGVVAGVLLVLIGLVALSEQYFNVSLEWLFDLWPFALVAVGGWLVWSSIRDRRRAGL